MRKPTPADAELLLRLYEIRRDPELRMARAWFLTDFKPGDWASIKATYLSHSDEDRHFRMTISYWQKINLLNDIAIIAPMLGLLGTVLGMFYAFYDLNRSAESISALFDGLGISVGTTVGGLVVAILALMFHAITKYRLTRQLTYVEARAEALAHTIKDSQ